VRPLISAHRGGGEVYPADTYEAYVAAAASGVELVEFDVRRLGDGTLVCCHDTPSAVRRGASQRATNEERTGPNHWASLDYGGLCSGLGYEVPLADRVMAAIAGRATGHVDLKAPGYEVSTVAMAVDHFGMDGFVVTTMEDASLRLIREAFPRVATALSLGRGVGDVPLRRLPGAIVEDLFPARRIRAVGATGASINKHYAPWGVLRRCAELGVVTMVWTLDRVEQLDRALANPRVDVVVTNRPLLAMERRALVRR
jgi:glycerophosphoryl diester phosphodiesterase